jgi:deazaflavin-dependent oxidoreductase (nitroreductase family)
VGRIPAVDPTAEPTRFQRIAHRAGMSGVGRWLGIHVSARIDPWLLRVSDGRLATTGFFPLVLLTVRGRRSGEPRTVPLVYFTRGDEVILTASSFGRARNPAWYLNLKANPEATLTTGGISGRYRAREAEGPERDELYALARRLYAGYGIYEQRAGERTIPVLALEPLDPPPGG